MAFEVEYSTRFVRTSSRLSPELKEEILERVEQLKDLKNHKRPKVHKLKGKLKDVWSFSVNYRIRITFFKPRKNVILLETVGTHDEVY